MIVACKWLHFLDWLWVVQTVFGSAPCMDCNLKLPFGLSSDCACSCRGKHKDKEKEIFRHFDELLGTKQQRR
jgi:hypothetical protein